MSTKAAVSVFAAIALVGCATHSNGQPVQRFDCGTGSCARFVVTGGQRQEADMGTYAVMDARHLVVGTCAFRFSGIWQSTESGDATACHEPEGWAVAP